MNGSKNEKKLKINTDKINKEIERRLKEEVKLPIIMVEKNFNVQISSNLHKRDKHYTFSSNVSESIKNKEDNEDLSTTIKDCFECKRSDIIVTKLSKEISNSFKYRENQEKVNKSNNSEKIHKEINNNHNNNNNLNNKKELAFKEDIENVNEEEAGENISDKWGKLLSNRDINLPSNQTLKMKNYNQITKIDASYDFDSHIYFNKKVNPIKDESNRWKYNQTKNMNNNNHNNNNHNNNNYNNNKLSENNLLSSIKNNVKNEYNLNAKSNKNKNKNKGDEFVKQSKLYTQIGHIAKLPMNTGFSSYFKSKSISGFNKIYDQINVHDRLYKKGLQTMKSKDESSNLNIHTKIIDSINGYDFKPILNNITRNKSIDISKRISFKSIFDFEDYKSKRKNINLSVTKFQMIKEKESLNSFSPIINRKLKMPENQKFYNEENKHLIDQSRIKPKQSCLKKLLENFHNSNTPKFIKPINKFLIKFTSRKKSNNNISEETIIPFSRIKSTSPLKSNPFSSKLEEFEDKEFKEKNSGRIKTFLSNSFKAKMHVKTDKILEKMKYKAFNVIYEILMNNLPTKNSSEIELSLMNHNLPPGIVKSIFPIIMSDEVYDINNKISISQFFKLLSTFYNSLSILEKNALLRIGQEHSKKRNDNKETKVK